MIVSSIGAMRALAGIIVATVMVAGCNRARERDSADSGAIADTTITTAAAPVRDSTSDTAPAVPAVPALPASPSTPGAPPVRGAPGEAHGSSSVAAADTARGVLLQTGSEPMTSLVLTPTSGAERLTLEGAAVDVLKAAEGLEIVVRGRLTATRAPGTPSASRVFEVASFTVRAAEGRAAHDGIVVRDTEGFALRLQDGTVRRAPHMPLSLQSKVGARVFLVGPLNGAPTAYGILAGPR